MTDKYNSFSRLAEKETLDKDYRVRLRERRDTIVVIAPHGGGIEPGTSELADAIAGDDLSFYAFEGIKLDGNRDLHITSTRFDEPQCVTLVTASPRAIAIHGEDSDGQVAFLGGLDETMRNRLRISLKARGFRVETHPDPTLGGCDKANICNRGKSGRGVQLELSNGRRRALFESLSRSGRRTKNEAFWLFVAAVREAIL